MMNMRCECERRDGAQGVCPAGCARVIYDVRASGSWIIEVKFPPRKSLGTNPSSLSIPRPQLLLLPCTAVIWVTGCMTMGPERMIHYHNISILMDKAGQRPASDHEGWVYYSSSTVTVRPPRANSTVAVWAAAAGQVP